MNLHLKFYFIILAIIVGMSLITTVAWTQDLDTLRKAYPSHEDALRVIQATIKTTQELRDKLTSELETCKTNLNQATGEDVACQKLKEQIDSLTQENQNLKATLEELRNSSKSERESCTVDLETATRRIKQLETEVVDCQRPSETMKEQVNSLTTEKQGLVTKVSRLESRITRLESEKRELQNTLTKQGEQNDSLKEQNDSLSSQLNEVREELRKKEKELESENKHLKNLNRPPPVSSAITDGVYGIVVTKETSLNVREGPGESYSIIDKAPKGLNLKILDKVDVWYKIQVGSGSVGYVRSDYIEPLRAGAYANAFPKYSCGDHNPGGIHEWYPVWVDDRGNNFVRISSRYCRDAFKKTYEGNAYIQVASFLREAEARGFAEFMQRQVGSGKVGEMITTGE